MQDLQFRPPQQLACDVLPASRGLSDTIEFCERNGMAGIARPAMLRVQQTGTSAQPCFLSLHYRYLYVSCG